MPRHKANDSETSPVDRFIEPNSNQLFSLDEGMYSYRRLKTGRSLKSEKKPKIFQRIARAYANHRLDMGNPLKLQVIELKWRIFARKRYGRAFFLLLLIQNIFVLWLVYDAYTQDRLEDLSLILGVFVAATLTETYFIFRIIVTQLFKEIRYKDYIKEHPDEEDPWLTS
jgi:hypothetical protein